MGAAFEGRASRRPQKISRDAKVYRVMFIVGMILGGLTTLLLPFHEWNLSLFGAEVHVRHTVVKLDYWARVAIYIAFVVAGGFFWAKQSVALSRKYWPERRRFTPQPPPDDGQQQQVYRLD